MLHREPLFACPSVHIPSGVDNSVLHLVLELGLIEGKGKGKVDSFFAKDLLLVHILDKFNFLFLIEDPNLCLDCRRIQVLAFHTSNRSKWGMFDGNHAATMS